MFFYHFHTLLRRSESLELWYLFCCLPLRPFVCWHHINVQYITYALMTERNHEKNPNQFGQHRDVNSELSEYDFSVMNFDRRYALCTQKLYHRPHFTVRGSWNKSLNLQPLQRCYCEDSGSAASACVMRRHYSITYTQSLHVINGLLALGRMGNWLYGPLRTIGYPLNLKLKLHCVIL